MSPSCPDCGAPLAGDRACRACGLPLVGDAAARLWLVDQRLASLGAEAAALQAERAQLLAALRATAPDVGVTPPHTTPARGAPPEWAPRRVQDLLLTLGAVLLGVAAAVFLAVSYQRVGIAGRAAVLTAVTALAAAVPVLLLRRRLAATAEALAGVAVALLVLDLWAARRLGLAGLDEPDVGRYVSGAGLGLAVAAGAYATLLRLRVPAVAAVLALQAAGLAEGLRDDPGRGGVVLALLAALDVALVVALRGMDAGRPAAAGAVRTRSHGRAADGGPAVRGAADGGPAVPGATPAHDPPPGPDQAGADLRRSGAAPAPGSVRVQARPQEAAAARAGAARAAAARAAAVGALLAWSLGLLGAVVAAALEGDTRPAAGALVLLAAVAGAAGAAVARDSRGRVAAWATATGTLCAAATTLVAEELLGDDQLLVVLAASGLLAVVGAAARSRPGRPAAPGVALGGVLVAAVAALGVAEDAATALVGPLGWSLDPWSRGAGDARALLAPDRSWDGTVAVLVVVATAAVATTLASLVTGRDRAAATAGAVGGVLVAVLLPLGLTAEYAGALASGVALGTAALAVGGWATRRARRERGAAASATPAPGTSGATSGPRTGTSATVGGAALLAHAAAWSLADRTATLVVLGVVAAVLAAAGAVGGAAAPALCAAAVLVAGGHAAALAASRDLHVDQLGAAVAAVGAAAVLLPLLVGVRSHRRTTATAGDRTTGGPSPAAGTRSSAVAAAGALLLGSGLLLAVGDPGWLSWLLVLAGLCALAAGVRHDRRAAAYLGTALLTAASWVRLADADVTAPEPYAVPVSLVALTLGHLRRRQDPRTGSLAAYGPGLAGGMLPSLAATMSDDGLARPLLLGAVALVVVVLGARSRLAGPLLVGGAVLVLDALRQLAPFADRLPRWLALAVTGSLLVGLGATWERRRRDLDRLRAGLSTLG